MAQVAVGSGRKIDSAGRVIIPQEARRILGVDEGDEVEFVYDNGDMLVKPVVDRCVFCASEENLLAYKGKRICVDCCTSLTGQPPYPAKG